MKTGPTRKITRNTAVLHGSGNVFEDLGFPRNQAAELKVKAKMTLQIGRRIEELGLTQVKAAKRLGISQPDVSKLVNGKHTGFTIERLMSLLILLAVDIDIVVRPKPCRGPARSGAVRVMERSVA
ncbi:MAG: XRE family transcriptional regulator [Phycisphaerales bacterium]|jgi:predicted XRE-type DNA-binding protein|nr:XRE family transcriptional regulator [Phycisphaerales bacterium]